MEKISKSKLRLLEKYFFENPKVSMAFLFGSQVKGQALFDSDVDILVLNKAPSLIAFDALRTGIPLVIKDGSLYLRFLLFISSAAMDFKEFIEDYWQIEQRSTSLSDFDKTSL